MYDILQQQEKYMKNENDKTIRLLFKSGQNICLHASDESIVELASHPKFVHMYDDSNDVMVSIEDISAFEIMDNRKIIPLQQPVEPPLEKSPEAIKELPKDVE